MTNCRRSLSAALLAVLFLAGCGGANQADPTNASSAGAGGPAPSSAPSAASPEPGDPAASASGAPGDPARPGKSIGPGLDPPSAPTETLTGQVVAGVEPGCLILTGPRGARMLVLTGETGKSVKVGARVTVTGHSEPRMMTTCQQGTPFVVTQATAN
jgi:hypothetical protein